MTAPADNQRFSPPRGVSLAAALLGLALVYLNLIPLEFSVLPGEVWWQRTLAMPWLDISLGGRADWVANLFMFVPFGFLLASAWGGAAPGALRRAGALFGTLAFGVVFAFAIEALQLHVPQRTVSLNDALAASLGGAIGVAAWWAMGGTIWHLAREATRPSPRTLIAGLGLYALAYVALSPFPYDFVVSAAEFRAKLAGGNYGAWLALPCETGVRCAGQIGVEVALAVPLGMLVAAVLHLAPSVRTLALAAAVGAAFGVFIEVLQFLAYSGISQGASILTRTLGFAMGAGAYAWLAARLLEQVQARGRLFAWLALLPYLVGLLAVTNVLFADWGDLASVAAQWQRLRLAPFYYHYFTTEQAAMASLLYTLALYAPVGFMCWPWHRPRRSCAWRAAVLAALLALGVETAKLWALELRPDPSNVFIAAFAAWAGLRLLHWLIRATHERSGQPQAVVAATPALAPGAADEVSPSRPERGLNPSRKRSPLALVGGLALGGVVLWAAATHPLSAVLALAGVIVVWTLVGRWPASWLVLVPASLPVLDLRPWTGRLYFDEWDLLVLAVLAALWVRHGWRHLEGAQVALVSWGRAWWGLYLVSYACAVLIALWPLAWPDALAFTSLHSEYNAVRLARGVLWAVLLSPFVHVVASSRAAAFGLFSAGMVLGLAAAVGSVLWERALFPGIFDYAEVYRAVGLFSDTHTGGAFLEAWLVTALPFLAAALLVPHKGWWRLFAYVIVVVLFVLASYAVAVTFARAGYAGWLIVVGVMVVGLVWQMARSRRTRLVALAGVLLIGGAGAAVLMHVQDADFMSQRVERERIERDLDIRVAHWKETLAPVLREGWAMTWGLGTGRFPELHFWERLFTAQPVPSIYQLVYDDVDGGRHLLLTPGGMTYVWQAVSLRPGETYRVRVAARSAGETPAVLGVMLCEQWLIYSRNCSRGGVRVNPLVRGEGGRVELQLRAPPAEAAVAGLKRPLKFVFHHAGGLDAIEIERFELLDASGAQSLINGDFSDGLTRWFFASDDHLAWHIKHMWGQVLFEQGVIGVVLWTLLVATALVSAVRGVAAGGQSSLPAAIVLAALLGFIAVGLFDSLFDAPRLATVFFLLLLFALTREHVGRPVQCDAGRLPDGRGAAV